MHRPAPGAVPDPVVFSDAAPCGAAAAVVRGCMPPRRARIVTLGAGQEDPECVRAQRPAPCQAASRVSMRGKRDAPSQRGGASAPLRRPLHRPCKAAPPGACQGAPGLPCGAVPARQRRRGAAGSVCVPAARRPAGWIGIGLGTVGKPNWRRRSEGSRRTARLLASGSCARDGGSAWEKSRLYSQKGRSHLGNRHNIIAGRSNVFSQYSTKFDGYRQILTMKRAGRE